MRILQISSARTLGGGERHVADLSNALAARGHEVYAALPHASPLRNELNRLPPSNIITLPLRNALDAASALRLARVVREKRIDIIHAHMARDYPLAALARRCAPHSRLIITRHVLFPMKRLNALTLRQASRVVAVSEAVADALRVRRIVPARRIAVIPNGIDLERLDASLHDFNRDRYRRLLQTRARFIVGTVGELSHVKGQDVFIRAASIIARALGDEVEFLIIGEDASRTGETRERLQNLIAEHGLQKRVRLLGRREDVAQLLSCLDVFVSASRSEAFGLAIVEAMACGVPVLAAATEGAREIIEDPATGRLVPVDDFAALAEAVLTLIRHPHAHAHISAHARERFSLKRMVDATEEVYNASLEMHKD